jgi:hypothetical protein
MTIRPPSCPLNSAGDITFVSPLRECEFSYRRVNGAAAPVMLRRMPVVLRGIKLRTALSCSGQILK